MSLAGEIVDGIVALIGGGMKLDAEMRAAAKQSVKETIARAKAADVGELLSMRADAIEAKHRERVAKVAASHGLDPESVSILAPPVVPLTSIPTESGIDLRRIIRGGPRTEGDEPVLPGNDEDGS